MVKEAVFMWIGNDGKMHYVDKEKVNQVLVGAEKAIDLGIRIAIISGVTCVTGGNVFAAEATRMSLAEGLQPIVDMIAECAYPVAGGYMVKGFLKVCQGKEEEGKTVLKNAGIGYMGTLFIPQILKFLSKLKLFV